MKKFGFTLAEVLITLSIIGVVAVLVMPVLMSDTQKHQWVQGLKTNYYDIQQGFARMLADQDSNSLLDTELWTDYIGAREYDVSSGQNNGKNEHIKKEFSRYFDISKAVIDMPSKYNPKAINQEDWSDWSSVVKDKTLKFYLNNSAIMMIHFDVNTSDALYATSARPIGQLYIDVTGEKGPNIAGRDIFEFSFLEDGKLKPNGYDGAWSSTEGCTDDAIKNNLFIGNGGTVCTARVIEEGWQMKY